MPSPNFKNMTPEERRELGRRGGQSAAGRKALTALIVKEARAALTQEVGDRSTLAKICSNLVETGCKGNVKALYLLLKMAGVDVEENLLAIAGENEGEQPTAQIIPKIRAFLDWQMVSSNLCFVYGTTRSGKTYGILQWLVAQLVSGSIKGQILVAGQTVPFLKNGACTYLREICANMPGVEVQENGKTIKHANGIITCQSFEDPSRALSAQWSAVYLNEGNYLETEVVDALRIRTAGITICDYNPSVADWWGKGKQTQTNELFTTFNDNPFLSSSQLAAIEEIRERGESAPEGSYENWYYHVYYLGEFSKMGGGVFTRVFASTPVDFDAAEGIEVHGIDWGDVKDPNALVRVKVNRATRDLWVQCLYYETATDDIRMAEILNANNVQRLVFETATGGQTRALNLRKLGYGGRLIPCEKEHVSQGVFNICGFAVHCCDDITLQEFKGYRIDGGQFKGADHCIDAVRYVAHLQLTDKIRE